MKQLNFFRKFMPFLIVYYLYLMVNETSYMIVKTFTRLHIYRSSSPSDKRGWGRGEGPLSHYGSQVVLKIRWGPDPATSCIQQPIADPPPHYRGSDTPGNILRRTFFDALKTGVLRAGHTNNKCLRTVITN